MNKIVKDFLSDSEYGFVERVIDGDTIVVNGSSIRLLGINSPEKGDYYYEEAKQFLNSSLKDMLVKLEKTKQDKDMYNRDLRYVFLDNQNINIELVENGLANFYFPLGKDKYYKNFKKAWENCIIKQINLCKSSSNKCSACIELSDLDYKNQKVIFYNKCSYGCDLTGWTIKDEGRKNFVFPQLTLKKGGLVEVKIGTGKNTGSTLFWEDVDYVWTETGDTLFLRDKDGGLVLWKNY